MTDISQAPDEREATRQAFIRVCRDSGFQMDALRAAVFTANLLGKHPMDIWTALPSLAAMHKIADGSHPACHLPSEQGEG